LSARGSAAAICRCPLDRRASRFRAAFRLPILKWGNCRSPIQHRLTGSAGITARKSAGLEYFSGALSPRRAGSQEGLLPLQQPHDRPVVRCRNHVQQFSVRQSEGGRDGQAQETSCAIADQSGTGIITVGEDIIETASLNNLTATTMSVTAAPGPGC